MTSSSQAVALVRQDRDPEQRRGDLTGGQQADRDGGCVLERVVLQDQHGARLARIIGAAGRRPDFPRFTSLADPPQSSEMVSRNAWSSASCGLCAINRDWRRASALNLGEVVSGTQNWTSFMPFARIRAR